ncbi:enhanced serine sensitivity protein SseB C-terminal domain-containing protein [Agreia sp. COWG]|uniref:enhanced serine sensitivity protein SseB C-terminal domain-containing protein n=1 Tax=Agreia sp. COWG TaxID=2773266 RepID=UPI00192956DB|nr:enhanced serine sensitivity protein SseB C-terminal domain-containing protein [Agreia sp. COWG]CAD5989766.1 conserved protein of unknown function [Agreia sp. COWG]
MTENDASRIESLLVEASQDRAAVPAFLTALLEATVFVSGVISDEGAADFSHLSTSEGGSILPFYSSEERLRETIAAVPGFEQRFVALPCRDLWQITRGATLVLNPHSPYGKEFLPGEIGQLLDGEAVLTQRIVDTDTEVFVGVPSHVPPGMTDALAELFAHHREVAEAVLGWKVTPGPGAVDESYHLVIVGAADARDALGGELGRVLTMYSLSAPVDVQFVESGEKHVLQSVRPFYRRKRGLFGRR